jgi:NADH-quinone oxidoreductase subunit A
MQYAFLPVFLFLACAIGLAIGLLVVAGLFNPGRPGRVTRMPYESGMDPIHDTRRRFDVRFHLLAIAFMLFDVELLFLYPWAVAVRGERNDECRMMNDESTTGATVKSEIRNPKSEIRHSPIHHSSFSTHHSVVFGGAMTFLLLLTLGYVYDWRKGVFRWR